MRPEIKNEIIINRCGNPRALAIDVATPRAAKWIKEEGAKYTADRMFTLLADRENVPASYTLIVSECYDVDDVEQHLQSPEYELNVTDIKSC